MDANIRLLRSQFLPGPNMWTYRPVLETWLDIGALEDCPSDRAPWLAERLPTLLPGLTEHACSVGEPGGFLQRLRNGTYAGHILEHVVLELQSRTGIAAGFGQTRQAVDDVGIYKMAFRTDNEATGRAALAEGMALLHAAWNRLPFDVAAALMRLRRVIDTAGAPSGRGPVATLGGGPLVGLTGGTETGAIAACAARLLISQGTPPALLSCKAGAGEARPGAHAGAVRAALEREPFAAALVDTDARAIANFGLPYRRCRIGAVSSFAGLGALDDLYIDRPARLHALLRTQVDVIGDDGVAVLNAQQPALLDMAPLCDGEVLLYGLAGNPALAAHIDAGGRAVEFGAHGFVLYGQARHHLLRAAPGMPSQLALQLCAALAVAWSLDVPLQRLQAALPELAHIANAT